MTQGNLTFRVEGDPLGQPRGRHVPGQRRPVSTMSKRHRVYKERLGAVARSEAEAGGWKRPDKLFGCNIIAYFAVPKRNPAPIGSYCGKKPDRDNIEKLILDALQDAGLTPDDAGCVQGGLTKVWAEYSSVFVHVWAIKEGEGPGIVK